MEEADGAVPWSGPIGMADGGVTLRRHIEGGHSGRHMGATWIRGGRRPRGHVATWPRGHMGRAPARWAQSGSRHPWCQCTRRACRRSARGGASSAHTRPAPPPPVGVAWASRGRHVGSRGASHARRVAITCSYSWRSKWDHMRVVWRSHAHTHGAARGGAARAVACGGVRWCAWLRWRAVACGGVRWRAG
eukprot:7386758-Prymnesium_polylepis.1